jgi:hypothetical protein
MRADLQLQIMATDEVLITRPIGATALERYLVAQVRGNTLRLCRVGEHGTAKFVAREWNTADYTWSPGELRKLNFPTTMATP